MRWEEGREVGEMRNLFLFLKVNVIVSVMVSFLLVSFSFFMVWENLSYDFIIFWGMYI